jgi:hypothetical protein
MSIVRVNFNEYNSGEQYENLLNDEANRNFQILLLLLSSYYLSKIDGPSYARELKAIAIELARVRLSLDQIQTDAYFKSTRGEFLYQTVTELLFPGEIPDPNFGDLDFRDFLVNVVAIYFKGSVPSSIKSAVELLTSGKVIVFENFKEARQPGSGLDISDQFGFQVDVILDSLTDSNIFLSDHNIRILLNIIRPAHTLYTLRFILKDVYIGQQTDRQPNKVLDKFSLDISNYGYEDFRKFVEGVKGIDDLGTKKAVSITAEDHSADF